MEQPYLGRAGVATLSAIEVAHVTKRHARNTVVDNVSFRAEA
jgi:hypothetical protein